MIGSSASAPVRIGARTSPLARAQATHIAELLRARGVASTFTGITTVGDVDRRELTEIGGTGVFASAVRDALRTGKIDVAVHSLKDLPTAATGDLELAAVPEREDVRDVIIGRRLDELTSGVRVGTGAPRRAMQLQAWSRERGLAITIEPIRGNVGTRLELVRRGVVDVVVLAAAGLRRLGLIGAGELHPDLRVQDLPADVLGTTIMLPAPGQGALALEILKSLPAETAAAVRSLNHSAAHAEVLAERGFLAALEAGCTAPVGARAVVKSVRGTSVDLTLSAVIGRTLVTNVTSSSPGSPLRLSVAGSTPDPHGFGTVAAEQALTELSGTTRSSADEAE